MRRVFQPPVQRSHRITSILAGLLLAFAIYVILPFTTAVSSSRSKQLLLSRVDIASPPPPAEVEDVPPPPQEKPPEPPPPELADSPPPPLNLNVSLDVAVGSGGALGLAGLQNADSGTALDAFDVSELERRPEIISQVPPAYPPELRKARVEGTVTVVFLLDDEGRVSDPRVEASSRAEFERPALDAVRKWRFKPGVKDGKPVKTYMRLPLRFRVANS
jgi:protein TonB